MRRLLYRAAALALCTLLACTGALADGVRFTVSADLDPVQYPEEQRSLWDGIAALLDAASFEGTLATNDGSFDLALTMQTETKDGMLETPLHVFGVDSHWGVQSPLLGDMTLMVNNLALLEFGVKANNHLGIPLQQLCLLVPYAHTSAWDALRPVFTPLLPESEGEFVLSPDELRTFAIGFAEAAEYDRTVRCWIEAAGMSSGTDALIFSLLPELPDYLAAIAPEGLTVIRTADTLTWKSGESTLLSLENIDRTTILSLALPEVCEINMNLRDDVSVLTGSLHVESPVLHAECSLSLPRSLPMVIPFFMNIEAEGPMVGEPFHIVMDSEIHGDLIVIRQLLPDHSRTMCTIFIGLTEYMPDVLPVYTPANIAGVNILSATSDSLRELMGKIGEPLIDGMFDLIVALPARTVQTFMDVLEDSNILQLLTDALTGAQTEAY